MDSEAGNQENAEETLSPREKYRKIIDQILNKNERKHNDFNDDNIEPSYTRFQLPYHIYCHNRYRAAKRKYEHQFQYEISQLLVQQASGYEAACLCRHLCITTLWPPLHNRKEIDRTQRYFFNLTERQYKRLKWIMSTKIV